MNSGRLVYLSHADVSWLHTSTETPERTAALMRLNIGFNSAPSDPLSAVSDALEQLIADDEKFATACEAVIKALGVPTRDTEPST